MRKILIFLLSVTIPVILLAKQMNFEEFKEEVIKGHYLDNLAVIKNMEKNLYITTEKKREIINSSKADEDFLRGLYALQFEKREKAWTKGSKLNLPNYVDGLKYFAKSAEKGNRLASYMGIELMWRYFLNPGNLIAEKYLRTISKPLAKDKNVIGLFWFGKSFTRDYGGDKEDLSKGIFALKLAKEEAKKLMEEREDLRNNKDFLAFVKNIELAAGKVSARQVLRDKIARGEKITVKRKIHWRPSPVKYSKTPAKVAGPDANPKAKK